MAGGWVAGVGVAGGAEVTSVVGAACFEAEDWLESEGVVFVASAGWVLGWGAVASTSASVEDAAWAVK